VLDARRLLVLHAVARRGSLAAAASELGYTPSAVSHHIARFERELGVALVERGANHLRLTAAGRALADRAPSLLDDLAAAEAEARAVGGLDRGDLRIGAFATAAATLVAAAVRGLLAERPGFALSVWEGDPEETLPRLRAGELDVALAYEYDFLPVRFDERLERRLLLVDAMRLVLPRGHRAASGPIPALADLAGERWIAEPRADCRHFTLHVLDAAGVDGDLACLSSDYAATQALVAAGVGLALVPELALRSPHPDVVVRPLVGCAPVRRVLACHRRGAERPELRALLQRLAAVAGPERSALSPAA